MLFDCVNIVKIRSQNGKKKLIWLWFNQTHDGGYPSFPVESFCLEKPLGANVVINIEQMDYVEYLIDMAAAEEHAFPNEYKPLKPIGNYEGFYPDEPFNISTISYTPTTEKFKVRVIPVSYNQATQIIRIPSKIVFSVKFTDVPTPSPKKTKINTSVEIDKIDWPGDLLIITVPEFKNQLNDFISWKRTLGYNVTFCARKWESNIQVKDSISYYMKQLPDLKDLLIVGDTAVVPSNLSELNEPHYTDLYYAYDPRDSMPTKNDELNSLLKLRRGRIPASDEIELRGAINKILTYEKCDAAYPQGFFSRGLHCANFQDGDSANQTTDFDASESDHTRFIENSETVAELSEKQNISVGRVYDCATVDLIAPKFYCELRNFQEIPKHLQNLKWNGNAGDILDSLKQGVCYVLYRGHGLNYAWNSPAYDIECIRDEYKIKDNFNDSPNRNYKYVRPIVFSITCNTGAFDQGKCFAKTSITHHRGGGSAVIAATEKSLSKWNNSLAIGVFCTLYNNPINSDFLKSNDIKHQDGWRIGQILDQGLRLMASNFNKITDFKYNKYQYEIYHCFGDPTMLIRTKEPSKYEAVTISKSNRNFKVNTGEGPAFIAFYDYVTKKSTCVYAKTAEFEFAEDNWTEDDLAPDEIKTNNSTIAVYGPNRIPYISQPLKWELSVTHDTKFEKCYFANNTLWISTDKPFGDNSFIFITSTFSGAEVFRAALESDHSDASFDVSSLSAGTYIVSILQNGQIIDSKVVQK